jgi:hypothetical protein
LVGLDARATREGFTMHRDALRLLILSKLADGRLPLNSTPKVWVGPGNGETCDACGVVIMKDEFVIEGISLAGGKRPLQLHTTCFRIWETERRPQLASDALPSAPVLASAPGRRRGPPSIISGQMNGYGVTRRDDEEE